MDYAKVKAALPKGTDYLVDVAVEAGTKNNTSPFLLLGICYAESNFGLALKPPGPAGSGDFIPRPCTPERDKRMVEFPLPGVVRQRLQDGIKARKIAGPCEAWVPTHTGWGCGLMQFDYEAFFDFCKSGAWKDPPRIMEQACKLIASNQRTISAKVPGLAPGALMLASIAAYNAGAGRVVKALLAKQALDTVTFHPGYHTKIERKASDLASLATGKVGTQGILPL